MLVVIWYTLDAGIQRKAILFLWVDIKIVILETTLRLKILPI